MKYEFAAIVSREQPSVPHRGTARECGKALTALGRGWCMQLTFASDGRPPRPTAQPELAPPNDDAAMRSLLLLSFVAPASAATVISLQGQGEQAQAHSARY